MVASECPPPGSANRPRVRRNAVLVEDFVDVAVGYDRVRANLGGDGHWLAPLARRAEAEGETLRLRLGPAWAGGRIRREVEVRLGPMRPRGDACVIALSWSAVGATALFPVLEGDLELASIGPGETRLTLSASYVPPLGGIGQVLDRALLHRLTQSTIRSFLGQLAEALGEESGARADDSDAETRTQPLD